MSNSCKICNNKTKELTHPKTCVKYYSCARCQFISKAQEHLVTKEEELKIYNTHQNFIDDAKYVAYFKDFIDNAVTPFSSGKTAFDFGSGPSPVLAKILERDYNFNVDIYDLFYSPKKVYENKQYDLITCTEVVEHLSEPMNYFLLFKKLAKVGGIISIMTLFHNCDEKSFFDWWYIRDKSHISFYTPKTFAVIAEQLGLEVIYSNDRRYTTFKKM